MSGLMGYEPMGISAGLHVDCKRHINPWRECRNRADGDLLLPWLMRSHGHRPRVVS